MRQDFTAALSRHPLQLWFPAAEQACVQFGRSYRAVRLFGIWEFLYSLLSSAHPFCFIAKCIKDLSSVA